MNKDKKANYYYIIAGLLAIIFSITHELNGRYSMIPLLYSGSLDIDTTMIFSYIWHVISAENFVFGIAFIVMAFCGKRVDVRFAAWLICAILIIRLCTVAGTTLIITGQLGNLMVDIIAIIIYIVIITIGIVIGKHP